MLMVYHNIQTVAKQDVPDAKAVYETLKGHFPGGKNCGDGNGSAW
jgi:hypothetical protein